MKTYPVYAVGTAIVDYEYKLPAAVPWPADLEKGCTVLIDEHQEKTLLTHLAGLTPFKSCGGTSANTLSLISGLGGRVFCSCKVADDEAGRLYHENLLAYQIENNSGPDARLTGATGRCLILIDEDAERSIFTQLGVNRSLSSADLHRDALLRSEFLFVETFLATSPSSKAAALAAMQMAREGNTKIALTLSTCKIPGFSIEHAADFTALGVDLLFCNELEASHFCGTEDLREMLAKLKTMAQQFVITRGAEATLLFDGKHLLEIPAYSTTAVNTTGAGDAFAGAFLHGLTTGMDFAIAGKLGNFAAAQAVKKPGARLDQEDLKRVEDFISDYL